MIKVSDIIYGTFELPAIFRELLNNKSLLRLRNVHQSGAIFLVNPDISHSRMEHSIGVMLLIRILGGSELEQIAGLLHDVSHTAFSHVGDYVFGNQEEDYHEKVFEPVLLHSDIPEILERFDYSIDQILRTDFSILEQPLPYLCADRIDYTLRDALHAKLITRKAARNFIDSITLKRGKIVVNDPMQAQWISSTLEKLNKEVFNHPLYVYANQQLAILIHDFIKKGTLTETDLLKDDVYLLNKIRSTSAGYEAIKSIKQQKGYPDFLKKGPHLKIKTRYLKPSL
ncbi:HD domain-containing protein [Pedobacter nutrimenti]|jgi:HD superfamily phosphohydrolase|uniref:HD domain-containing protein n=1 Tax=Pedobacter nutrimenti TaxID=1241337 RepID=A0A318U9P4_9SPHI|nr:HD domain-containing protein [Pedobacter nutrimenti]PYF71624.1 hypothetical protein B0O44_107239 [Pedobacter nutrimenti]